MKQALGIGLSLGIAGTLLQSCETAPIASSLNFANWASAETATRNDIDQVLQIFKSRNNVQVNNIAMPFDGALTQLTELIHAKIVLDVMELSGNWPFALAGIGALADLSPFVTRDWYQDSFSNSFTVGTYEGTLYAVPFSITPHGFWYNRKLLASAGLNPTRPPRTMSELNQAMTVLRAKLSATSYPLGLDTSVTEYALVGFWPWIWTFGGNPMIDNGDGNVTIDWTDDGTVAAFQWLQDAIRARWSPPNLAIKTEREMMAEEQIVFKLDGPYLSGILGSFNPAFSTIQQVNGTFSVATTPLGPGVTQPVTCADIHNLAISSSSSNQELSWKLIDFLTTSREVITSFLIPEGGMLPHRSYNLNPHLYGRYYADPINQAFINAVIPTMRSPAYGPRYSTAALAIAAAIQDVSQGAAVKPRLAHLTEEVKALYT